MAMYDESMFEMPHVSPAGSGPSPAGASTGGGGGGGGGGGKGRGREGKEKESFDCTHPGCGQVCCTALCLVNLGVCSGGVDACKRSFACH